MGQIKIDEGYREEIYLCSMRKMSWLYGRNIKDRPITPHEFSLLETMLLTGFKMKDWADKLFEIEIKKIRTNLYFGYNFDLNEYPEEVANIILNLSYNMGLTKFNPDKWPKFFKAIKERNWKQAATEGRDSLWFTQVGQRSVRLMNSLENVEG